MVGKFRKAAIALAMGATLAGVAATPAEAQRYGRGWNGHRGGVSAGTAIGIGLLGLGVGIAASQGGYGYRGGGYYRGPGYYGYAPPRRYVRECWRERLWDDYYGEWVVRRVCR